MDKMVETNKRHQVVTVDRDSEHLRHFGGGYQSSTCTGVARRSYTPQQSLETLARFFEVGFRARFSRVAAYVHASNAQQARVEQDTVGELLQQVLQIITLSGMRSKKPSVKLRQHGERDLELVPPIVSGMWFLWNCVDIVPSHAIAKCTCTNNNDTKMQSSLNAPRWTRSCSMTTMSSRLLTMMMQMTSLWVPARLRSSHNEVRGLCAHE